MRIPEKTTDNIYLWLQLLWPMPFFSVCITSISVVWYKGVPGKEMLPFQILRLSSYHLQYSTIWSCRISRMIQIFPILFFPSTQFSLLLHIKIKYTDKIVILKQREYCTYYHENKHRSCTCILYEAESSEGLWLTISKKLIKTLSREDYLCTRTDVEIN